jgi:hypothetical protein
MAENASKGGSGGGFFGRLTSFGGGNAGVRSLYLIFIFSKSSLVSFVNILIRNPLFSPRVDEFSRCAKQREMVVVLFTSG